MGRLLMLGCGRCGRCGRWATIDPNISPIHPMDILGNARATIISAMGLIPAWVVFRVDGNELWQNASSPYDLTVSGTGVSARARKLSSTQAISIQGAAVGAQIWECQTVGDGESTPQMAELMKATAGWEIQLGKGNEFIPARVIELSPSELGVGWRVLLEVFPT